LILLWLRIYVLRLVLDFHCNIWNSQIVDLLHLSETCKFDSNSADDSFLQKYFFWCYDLLLNITWLAWFIWMMSKWYNTVTKCCALLLLILKNYIDISVPSAVWLKIQNHSSYRILKVYQENVTSILTCSMIYRSANCNELAHRCRYALPDSCNFHNKTYIS